MTTASAMASVNLSFDHVDGDITTTAKFTSDSTFDSTSDSTSDVHFLFVVRSEHDGGVDVGSSAALNIQI